ncbi:hypothetical protein A5680_09680 [Mycobacterium sp. E2989]|nr:hypothetical protein A5680_09680 [Mycobacterium sp. E2989]
MSDDTKPRKWSVPYWNTIAVCPLPPGWINVYRLGCNVVAYDAPALLLQECTQTARCWEEPNGDGTFTPRDRIEKHERETRVVFADVDGGELCEANGANNFVASIPETRLAELLEREAAEGNPQR